MANRGGRISGSGDASQTFQSFTLKQPPLTFISAPTPAGTESTLKVYVDDMQWREANTLADLVGTDRKLVTKTNDEGKTTVIFGNGRAARVCPLASKTSEPSIETASDGSATCAPGRSACFSPSRSV